ncbi:MAG: DUF58 domain-containing protein [Cyanobacteria bacterium P01_D01_bin.105]
MNRLIYRILRFNHYLRQWIFTQFTPSGLGLLCAAFAAGLIGIDIKRSVSYQIFAFFVALLLVSICLLPFVRYRLSISRTLPRFGTVGVPLTYRIHIHNPTRKRLAGLKLFERFSNAFPTFEEFQQVFKGKREFQRRAWFALLARKQWAFAPAQDLSILMAKGNTDVTCEVMPLRRGVLHFQKMVIACPESLGFVNRQLRLSLPQSVLVLPKRYQLPNVELPGTQHPYTSGLALSTTKGSSEEFRSLREYRPGDSPRKIHWKSWAKTGRPIIKEEQDNHSVRHALILDTFQPEDYSEALEEGVAIAASFAYTIQTQQSLLDLVIVGPQAHTFSASSNAGVSLTHTERLLELLASVQPCQDKPFDALLPTVQQNMANMGGCICIFLNWDGDRKTLVEQLQMSGIPVWVLVIKGEKGLREEIDRSCLRTQQSRIEVLNINNIQEALLKL